ncbi:protein regulator of cytokinesis 1-like isoform X2 [Cimex lectularius]|uniref:Protein regulator of cytokinesis 1 n=1 Tax=Cimex lectularius TaxID=79782 RepID=A0A8I6RQS9_CIMLE|nr:protein regulator of cytokinesis 1-like isoform X2 [Cimex lectularius]
MSAKLIENGIQELLKKFDTMTIEFISELLQKWKTMYVVDDIFIDKKFKQLLNYLEEFYSEILESSEKRKEELIKEIEDKLKEHSLLQKELRLEIKRNVKENEPLTVVISKLDDAMSEYKELKNMRIKKMEALKLKETELCALLSRPELEINDPVPSEAQLIQIEEYIFKLQQEKIEKQSIYHTAKARITEMMGRLEQEPQLAFEKEVFGEKFILSDENLKQLKALESCLENDIEHAEMKISLLKAKLEKLWSRINVDRDYKQEFFVKYKGVGKSVSDAFMAELERCEEIKLANIKPMVLNARQEISDLWDKLTYVDEQRKEFHPYYTDLFSEDVLDLHEMECTKLHNFYEENKLIFELADKREVLWQRMLHLEDVAQDKSRLFNNRGGKLLKEEKERKHLENSLPKIDAQLRQELSNFQENHGTPFLWYGEDLLAKINSSWEERAQLKQSKIQSRKNVQKSEANAPMSAKRKTPMTPKVYQAKCLKKTPSSQVYPIQAMTPAPADVSNASIASYSHFQEQIESVYLVTPKSCNGKRPAQKENDASPIRTHSSPTATPKSAKRTRYITTGLTTPKITPRRLITGSASEKKRLLPR